ncbi:MAG: hypothetical protein J5706_02365, partial [Elusimicrobiales bacterium]|nr:hypothetical protein [Elusimicrobiales bacterium]
VGYDSDIRMGLNANRISNPNETFSNTNRKTVAALLKTSISSELKNTEAGKQALNGGLKIEVGFCDAGYSELKNDGTIVIDEGLIEEYMRLKGYTASSIMKNKKQLADVARYVSPEVVYQSARRDQEKWAKNTYKPHTQEDEIDARSREAVYMTEKMQKDSNFYGTFTDVEKYSSYASKNIENANSYNQGRKMFSDNVRMDNADLPTINSAAANTISLLNEEINRISKLSAKERAAERPNEKDMLSFSEVSKYTPDEISASIHDIQYTALVKLRNALMSNSYAQYNNKAIEQSRSTFNSIKPEQN